MQRDNYNLVKWTDQVFSTNVSSRSFDCNTIVFKNQGTQPVTINQANILLPGMGYTYECYPGEMDTTEYSIVFENERAAGANLLVSYKQYATPPATSWQKTPVVPAGK